MCNTVIRRVDEGEGDAESATMNDCILNDRKNIVETMFKII